MGIVTNKLSELKNEKVYDRPHNIDINCGFRIGHKNLSIFQNY